MLQKTRTPPALESNAGADDTPTGEFLMSSIDFARRQIFVIIPVLALTASLAVAYLIITPYSYTAKATILIDTRKQSSFQQQRDDGDAAIDTGVVDSQVEVLKSEKISLAVIKELLLVEDPEFVARGGGALGALFGTRPTSELELKRRAVAAFGERLTVKRLGLTYIIQISFVSRDPDRAARIANAVANAYIFDQLDSRYQATRRTTIWLQDRIKELRQQASSAEQAVVDFKAGHNIVDTGVGGRLMNEQQLGELNTQLLLARAQTAEAKAGLDRIIEIMSADTPEATVTDTLRNDVITKLREQYLELKHRYADLSAHYGHDHLAAVSLRNQMAEIGSSIRDEFRRIAETYKSNYEIMRQREETIQTELAKTVSTSQTTNQSQVALRDLESTAHVYRDLHDNFMRSYTESVQQQSIPVTEARLITQATRPLENSSPKTMMILIISGVSGLILGVGVARLRESLDRVFRTSDQVEAELKTKCISVVPAVSVRWTRDTQAHSADLGPRIIAPQQSVARQVIDAPFSAFTEAIRSIKVTADSNRPNNSNKVIGFTSILPNEGKSTLACSLGQLISHAGARMILVDCDLRNPALTRTLAPGASSGILEVVTGKASLADVVWTDPSTGLTFLPAVVENDFAHTSELLGSDSMRKLFISLREQYDFVVVDNSPLSPVVDVRSTTQFVDTYVMVVEWGQTKRDTVKYALGATPSIYEAMLGVVLNKADMRSLRRYDSRHNDYYSTRYYSRYGYRK